MPDYNITLFFYNPNIEPQEEFEKRKNEIPRLLSKSSFTSDVDILNCEYDNTAFSNAVLSLRKEPEGGARCRICFELRLAKTAQTAKTGEYDIFATTLSVSPHKNAKLLNEIGQRLADEYGVKHLTSDFKKNNGYKRSVELSKEYDLYRQSYCGCKDFGSLDEGAVNDVD